MSRGGGAASSRGRGEASAALPFPPQFYPVVGYQGPPHPWFSPHAATGVPAPWSPSWRPPVSYPAPTPPWSAQHTPSTTIGSNTTGTNPSDEYTVDTLRRIYKDDDGRVEIQRVKVQRHHPEASAVSLTGSEAMSVVPVGSFSLNERRPPPRKNRRKQEIHVTTMGPAGPYPWYPYMPYMPYPYPYPYYIAGCMWPPGASSDSVSTWSGNDESEGVSSHQDSALNSQRLESRVSHLSRDSLSSAPHRSSSPAAASQITDLHSLAPSDSVSVRGRKRESSLERALLGPTPPPRTKSRMSSSLGCKSDDAGKTQEWMLEMQRALRTSGDHAVKAPAKGSQKNDPSDVIYKKIPPVRKRRKMKVDDMSDKSSMIDLKDLEDISERQSAVSDAAFDESRLSSELNYAFRKFERSVDNFKTRLATDPSPLHSHTASPSVDISHSSGDVTPAEAHVPPLSDIRGLAEKAKEEETERSQKHGRPRAISESVSSPPTMETERTGSAPDISLYSSQHTTSTDTSTVTATSTTTTTSSYPSPPVTAVATSIEQVIPSPVKTQGKHKASSASKELPQVTMKVKCVLGVPLQPPASEETAETSDATVIHSPQNTTCTSSVAQSSQVQLPATTTATVTTQAAIETKAGISKVPTELEVSPTAGADEISKVKPAEISRTGNMANGAGVGEVSGRQSQASNATTFFSTRTADDSHALDTDSTDIPLPTTDSATADENEESPESAGPEDDHPWVLQRPSEAPTLNTAGQDERRNAWRAEVSLWRARLVVSLCRGRGLDRQDWATFHLMVHHPLTLDLKLSLLHAPRLCVTNSSIGPAVLRVALIQLAQYGETLLQPEAARQPGWRSIRLDAGHAWAPVKGATEILQSLGYQERGQGTELRYRRRCNPEASVVARLALDMLVLAEEFRLFLTGTHPYPNNISDLFYPESPAVCIVPDPPQRPPSSEGSFVSAQSEVVPVARPESEASSVTDEDTETLETCALAVKSHEELPRNRSTSDEDTTLREDDTRNAPVERASAEVKGMEIKPNSQAITGTDSRTPPTGSDAQQLPVPASDSASLNSDETSLPDLHCSTASGGSQRPSGSEISSGNETITPIASPTPALEVNSAPKASEANHITQPTHAPEATTDNPEEHVYEEIDVIRAQVQNLKESIVPVESAPPPLPPKKKVSPGGEDDSELSLTYPQVEWSSASMSGSLRGGSSGARRKKRRAPMPPEFLPQDWKQSQEVTIKDDPEPTVKIRESKEPDNAKKAEYRRSLNPFYEEIDSVQDEVKKMENSKLSSPQDTPANSSINGNPFLDDVKATGYIGKNPFYDDVEILKKRDKYIEMKTKQPSPTPPKEELTSATGAPSEQKEQQSDPLVVRPKRKAPRPPATPESLKKLPVPHTPDHSQEPASPRHTPAAPPSPAIPEVNGQGEGKSLVSSRPEVPEGRENKSTGSDKVSGIDGTDQPQESCDQMKTLSSSPASPDSIKNNFEDGVEPEPEVKIILKKGPNDKTMTASSSAMPPPTDSHQEGETETTLNTTPKQTRAVRGSPAPPRAPPPPPPTAVRSPAAAISAENSVKTPKEDSPPPVPPPKVQLSLLDEIPYMDANELKEAKDQIQSSPHSLHTGNEAAPRQFSLASPRQPMLVLAVTSVDADLSPDCPPPLPPCPPPESPPETPHTSPPETPHVSPPETPHTSPPATPHASPPATPHPSPKPSRLLYRHLPQDSLALTKKCSVDEKVEVTEKDEDEAPLVPPKTTQLRSQSSQIPAQTPVLAPSLDASQRATTLQPQEASSAIHCPVTGSYSVQSSASEERYEIPDTSRAPPPRPPVPMPPKAQQHQTNGKASAPPAEYDRYEVPEAPKEPVEGTLRSGERTKATETEERYEIPEVVKELPLKLGVNGAACTVAPARTSSPRRGDITAVFGPPKPPRRRRNNHSPPPRPPKNPALLHDALSGGTPRPPSTASSLTSSSSGPPPASLHLTKTPPKRRSWPFLLCDCLYVNCRTYEDLDK